MLKTALAAGLTNENLEQGGQKIQVKDQGEKKPTQKSCKGQKGQKRLSSRSGSMPKKQRLLELRTLANQVCFLLPMLKGSLLN